MRSKIEFTYPRYIAELAQLDLAQFAPQHMPSIKRSMTKQAQELGFQFNPLHLAVIFNDLEAILAYARANPDTWHEALEQTDSNGNTPMMLAEELNKYQYDAVDDPRKFITQYLNKEKVKQLIRAQDIEYELVSGLKASASTFSLISGNRPDLLKARLEAHPELVHLVNSLVQYQTPFLYACSLGRYNMVFDLIDCGADHLFVNKQALNYQQLCENSETITDTKKRSIFQRQILQAISAKKGGCKSNYKTMQRTAQRIEALSWHTKNIPKCKAHKTAQKAGFLTFAFNTILAADQSDSCTPEMYQELTVARLKALKTHPAVRYRAILHMPILSCFASRHTHSDDAIDEMIARVKQTKLVTATQTYSTQILQFDYHGSCWEITPPEKDTLAIRPRKVKK